MKIKSPRAIEILRRNEIGCIELGQKESVKQLSTANGKTPRHIVASGTQYFCNNGFVIPLFDLSFIIIMLSMVSSIFPIIPAPSECSMQVNAYDVKASG